MILQSNNDRYFLWKLHSMKNLYCVKNVGAFCNSLIFIGAIV